MRFGRTDHPVDTLAVRVDGAGRSLLYSADTGSAWDPRPLGAGVDVLLSEASLPTDEEDRFEHLSGRQAGAYATALGAGRLVLTHIAPGVDPDDQRRAAAGEYGGPIERGDPRRRGSRSDGERGRADRLRACGPVQPRRLPCGR